MPTEEIKQLENDLQPLREIREWVFQHEPCGYYCDEGVGHVDHRYTRWLDSIIHNIEQIIERQPKPDGWHDPDGTRFIK